MLVSCRDKSTSYIGETKSIRRHLDQHNSGYGSTSTSSSLLCLFCLFAYICGFHNNKYLQTYLEKCWKGHCDRLCRSGIHCLKEWENRDQSAIYPINEEDFAIDKTNN